MFTEKEYEYQSYVSDNLCFLLAVKVSKCGYCSLFDRAFFRWEHGSVQALYSVTFPRWMKAMANRIYRRIKYRLVQFPPITASALVHKFLDGTFIQVVLCHKNQQKQLVYVALNWVASLEGLFLTNMASDFHILSRLCSTALSIKELLDEYLG